MEHLVGIFSFLDIFKPQPVTAVDLPIAPELAHGPQGHEGPEWGDSWDFWYLEDVEENDSASRAERADRYAKQRRHTSDLRKCLLYMTVVERNRAENIGFLGSASFSVLTQFYGALTKDAILVNI
jgi:hypothetical protein